MASVILAVFERLSFPVLEHILQSLSEEPETSLISVQSQPAGDGTTPDGLIKASFAYWLETKRVANALRETQIRGHLRALDCQRRVERQRLIVLTPDRERPAVLEGIRDARVVWASFDMLLTAIQRVVEASGRWLEFDQPVVTQAEKDLLQELVRLLVAERVVTLGADRAVVVAARRALGDYQRYSVYICQPHRAFQPCSHMAFYSQGRINRVVPAIIRVVPAVVLTRKGVAAARELPVNARTDLRRLVDRLMKDGGNRLGQEQQVMFLSEATAPQTIRLPHDVRHDLPGAFTQSQRYVSVAALRKGPRVTSALTSAGA